jgi:hypothetical protein
MDIQNSEEHFSNNVFEAGTPHDYSNRHRGKFLGSAGNFRHSESLLIEHFDIDAVRSAIEQLSVTHREVILLCDVEEASYREIAEILSIPIGTVMSRLARARKTLCELLGRAPCAPLASGFAHSIETHEKDARVAGAATRTAGYERRGHRSELLRRRVSV